MGSGFSIKFLKRCTTLTDTYHSQKKKISRLKLLISYITFTTVFCSGHRNFRKFWNKTSNLVRFLTVSCDIVHIVPVSFVGVFHFRARWYMSASYFIHNWECLTRWLTRWGGINNIPRPTGSHSLSFPSNKTRPKYSKSNLLPFHNKPNRTYAWLTYRAHMTQDQILL